jgi:hypothetical protein
MGGSYDTKDAALSNAKVKMQNANAASRVNIRRLVETTIAPRMRAI